MPQEYKPALGKLLKKDGRAVMIAMDHARMNGVYKGLENPANVIEALIEGGADAIMTSYGVIKQYGHLMHGRIAKILRLDTGSSKYRESWEEYTEWYRVFSVEDALRIGAEGVILSGFMGIAVDAITLRNWGQTAAEADKYGMPFIAEVHASPSPRIDDSLSAEHLANVARIGAEFGADLIKVDYPGDAESFRKVTSTCPVPVLIAGGAKTGTTREMLEVVRGMIDGGGKGTVAGRNMWQHEDPVAITCAVAAIVHGNASVEKALAVFDGARRNRSSRI